MEETNTTNFTLNDTVNASVEEYLCSTIPYIAFAGVCLTISLCGLVGNGMVMWFLGFQMKLNPFTVYILNLAVADFSLLLLFLLLILDFLTYAEFCKYLFDSLYRHDWKFSFTFEFLSHLFDLSSLGLLTALSVDRCVSVLCPIWYRCHRPRHLSGIICGAVWALAGVLASSLYFTYYFTEDADIIVSYLALTIYMVFSVMMLVSNLFLLLKLCCGSRRRHLGKSFVTILLNILVFFACGIPFCVEVILSLPRTGDLFPEKTSFLLAVLNSSLNPVIYVLVGSWRRRHFQRSLRVALQRVFEENAGSDEGSHGPGDTAVEVTAV